MRRRSTRTRPTDPDDPDVAAVAEAALVLRSGGLVAFPTETVYGLGADATSAEAVAGIFAAKGRPSDNPLIVHVAGAGMARSVVSDWPEAAARLADRFWPGPLTLVLPKGPTIAGVVTAGGPTVGVRVPMPTVARRVIEAAGLPVAAPSANRSNGVSPTTAAHVLDDLDGRVDLILDAGPTTIGLESTVVDLTTRRPRVLRPGPLTVGEIESVVGPVLADEAGRAGPSSPGRLSSPGQLPVHYAPRTLAVRVESPADLSGFDAEVPTFVLALGTHDLPEISDAWALEILADPKAAATGLYATLRRIDAGAFDLLLILPPPDRQEWHAIRDRIARASRSIY